MNRFKLGSRIYIVFALILSACTGGAPDSDLQNGGESLRLTILTPPPKSDVDRVVWNLPWGEPTSLDSTKSYYFGENSVLTNMCESLLRQLPDYSFGPGLAESFSNPNPTTWVYDIRNDVTFWDGKPLTANDVAFSLGRNLDPTSFWNIWFQNVKSIDVTGRFQVTVTLIEPDYLFNQFMATAGGVVNQEAYVLKKGRQYGTPQGGLMCTGPFKFGNWLPGRSITIVRNDRYWDASLRPRASEIQFQFITDPSALESALVSGEVDGTYSPAFSSISRLQQSDAGNLYFGTSFLGMYISAFDNNSPLSTDSRIRQALLLAIDRVSIARTIYSGAALPLRAIAPPAMWGYSEKIFQSAYDKLPVQADISAARRLVEEAGSPTEKMVIAAQPVGEQVQLANIVAASAQEIGLNIQVKVLPPAIFTNLFFDPKARAGFSGFLFPTYSDIADPLEPYVYAGLPDSLYNYAGYSNPTVTEKVTQALHTADLTKRAQLISEAQAQAMKDLPYIPIVSPYTVLFMNKRITGAPATNVFVYYPWAAKLGGS